VSLRQPRVNLRRGELSSAFRGDFRVFSAALHDAVAAMRYPPV
jgi:hypothetical protein